MDKSFRISLSYSLIGFGTFLLLISIILLGSQRLEILPETGTIYPAITSASVSCVNRSANLTVSYNFYDYGTSDYYKDVAFYPIEGRGGCIAPRVTEPADTLYYPPDFNCDALPFTANNIQVIIYAVAQSRIDGRYYRSANYYLMIPDCTVETISTPTALPTETSTPVPTTITALPTVTTTPTPTVINSSVIIPTVTVKPTQTNIIPANQGSAIVSTTPIADTPTDIPITQLVEDTAYPSVTIIKTIETDNNASVSSDPKPLGIFLGISGLLLIASGSTVLVKNRKIYFPPKTKTGELPVTDQLC